MIREALEAEVDGYQLYHARRPEFASDEPIPFKLADKPFDLSSAEHLELQKLGREVSHYVAAVDELYHTDETVKELLDRGKPPVFTKDRDTKYLFIRPDLIIAEDGFKVCEIETSPFGLGVAHALNQAYRSVGFETIVNGDLADHLARELPQSGLIIDSQKTSAYRGQLCYTADRIFSAGGRDWQLQSASDFKASEGKDSSSAVYRAFYLNEYESDESVEYVVDYNDAEGVEMIPSLTPHIEEKAIMALLWDSRWDSYFKTALGEASCEYLREVIPKTMIIGEEQYFMPGLPGNASSTADIANLSRSKRSLVLKTSGYDPAGSWAEGVAFLHQLSRVKVATLLGRAVVKTNGLQIIQEFHGGKKVPVASTEDGVRCNNEVRVRLTPYVDPKTGKIIAAKVTGRSGTDFIHASTDSINAPVGAKNL